MRKSVASILAVAGTVAVAMPASAADIDFTALYGGGTFHTGIMHEQATGEVFDLSGYSNPVSLIRYANTGDFETQTNGIAVPIANYKYGTYFAAKDGYIYGHGGSSSDYNSNSLGKWDMSDGSLVATQSYTDFNGFNQSDSFDWGGFSAMNVFQDSTGMYLYSGSSTGSTFSLARLGTDLSISNIITGLPGSPGFGFMAGGKLFIGENYYSTAISYSIYAATGAIDDFDDISLGGIANPYTTHMEYIEATDTLYARSGGTFYKATGVADILGVQTAAVPEPSTWAMMLLGFFGMGGAMRRRFEPAEVCPLRLTALGSACTP